MNYEKLVREWVKHFGGSVETKDGDQFPLYTVILPDGMADDDGNTEVVASGWETLYTYLTQDVVYAPVVVGPVPGGAR